MQEIVSVLNKMILLSFGLYIPHPLCKLCLHHPPIWAFKYIINAHC